MRIHNLRSVWCFSVKVVFLTCMVINLGYANVANGESKRKTIQPVRPPMNLRISISTQNLTRQSSLPEGLSGIAAKYPGDKNIENDPDVIFVEKFIKGMQSNALKPITLSKIFKSWDDVSGKDIMHLSPDVPKNSADESSLLMTHIGGKGSGGGLYRRLLPGFECLFARFYIKIDSDCAPISHLFALGGYNPPTPWLQGGSGTRPDGSDRFSAGVETSGNKWRWDFYTYWQDMHVHGDGKYWGTSFLPGGRGPSVERGKWICIELMVKMNNPLDASNGEQAFWIDGRLWRRGNQVVSHFGPGFPKGQWGGGWWSPDENSNESFEGFRWRNIENLAINYIWAALYMPNVPSGHVSKVWFDNIVVAKKYIGPIQPIN